MTSQLTKLFYCERAYIVHIQTGDTLVFKSESLWVTLNVDCVAFQNELKLLLHELSMYNDRRQHNFERNQEFARHTSCVISKVSISDYG